MISASIKDWLKREAYAGWLRPSQQLSMNGEKELMNRPSRLMKGFCKVVVNFRLEEWQKSSRPEG
jgi:hypothetical protein